MNKLKRVRDAWVIPGPVPSYHEKMKEKLRREWPTLAQALDGLCCDGSKGDDCDCSCHNWKGQK